MSIVAIHRFARPGMGSVNTFFVETPSGLVVIDGQRELSTARAARAEIARTGKPILAAFLTHPHPDHFGGIGVFAPEGSGVPLYASAQTGASIREDRWGLVRASRQVVGDDFPEAVRRPDHVLCDGQPITVDGVTLVPAEMGGGEAECMTVLHCPEQKALFVGDVLQVGMTAYLVEGRARAWLGQLAAVRRRFAGVEMAYPGHGEPGVLEALLDGQVAYLETFVDLVERHGPDAARAAMASRFPSHLPVAAIPELLEADAQALAAEIEARGPETPRSLP